MLALDVRHLELGIVIALTTGLAAVAVLPTAPPSAPAMSASMPASMPVSMPAPMPEKLALGHTETAAGACNPEGVTAVVFKGTVHALDPDQRATFHFRFADLPSRYSVMTGANGSFEVRIPREELGVLDLCDLPSSGQRPASFRDASMTISYELVFER